jgi:inosose dehydratase
VDLKLGCFALIEPFAGFAAQLKHIRSLGLNFADLTDNHDGAALGVQFGFSPSVSLDSHPEPIRSLIKQSGIELVSICAHASLLDPTSPETYGTAQIIKAIRLAHLLGVKHVVTTEGEPATKFGHELTPEHRIFSIVEKLQSPIRWAEELRIELLLEPHGIVTGSLNGMALLLRELGHEDTIGICLDTGNSWLAGSDPAEFVRQFGPMVKHVHWKDLGREWLPKRGRVFGCGMGNVGIGDGLINIQEVITELQRIGFTGSTTLEVAGTENIRISVERLQRWFGCISQPTADRSARHSSGSVVPSSPRT